MGAGSSTSRGRRGSGSGEAAAYPLPALSPIPAGERTWEPAHSRGPPPDGAAGGVVGAAAAAGAGLRQKTALPSTVLRPATKACSEATTRPSTERPNTQYVVGGGFGVEPAVSPPLSDRSQDATRKECVVHFPPAPEGGDINEEDGKSSTTHVTASAQDPGSLPPSRGMTPASNPLSPPSSRPGTRGVDTSLEIQHELGEERMVFDDLEEEDPDALFSPCSETDRRDPDEQQGRVRDDTEGGESRGEVGSGDPATVHAVPDPDVDNLVQEDADPGVEALESGLPSRMARRAMSTRRVCHCVGYCWRQTRFFFLTRI
jgi:hypothetical protein